MKDIFLGFAFGMGTRDNTNINQGFPFPLVKKCVFSENYNENGIQIELFNGNNNPGFSGGPVFFFNRTNPKDKILHLVGIVVPYREQQNKLKTKVGTIDYSENSGIINAFAPIHIRQILTPNGF
jgi:hypothetical protein